MGAAAAAFAMVTCGSDPVRDGMAAPASPDASEADTGDAGNAGTNGAGASGPGCAGPFVSGWSDGAIAALLEVEDQEEVTLAQAVRAGLEGADVVAFAEKSITDDTLLLLQAEGAVRTDAIAIVETGEGAAVVAQEQQTAHALAALSGVDLDRAYMEHEVLVCMQELTWLDRIAAVDVRDVRLAAIVQATRALAATHWTLALQVLDSAMQESGGAPHRVGTAVQPP